MIKVSLFICLVVFSCDLAAQKQKFYFKTSGDSQIQQIIRNALPSNAEPIFSRQFGVIHANLDLVKESDERLIEGMDNKYYSKQKAIITLKTLNQLHPKTEYSKTVNVSRSVNEDVKSKILQSILKDKEFMLKLKVEIENQYSKSVNDCKEVDAIMETLYQQNNFADGIAFTEILDDNLNCNINSKKLKLRQAYENSICEKIQFELKLALGGGDEIALKKCLRSLLFMDITNPCRNEIISILDKVSTSQKSKYNIYINLLHQPKPLDILDHYFRQE